MKGLFTRGLVGGLGALVTASALMVGTADAYPTIGVCQYDAETNITQCSYSNPYGIKSVFISLSTDEGIVVVVNETYDCETPVFVEWENLGPAHHYEVEACPPDPAVPDPEQPPVGSLPDVPGPGVPDPDPFPVGFQVAPPRVIDDLKQPTAPTRLPGDGSQTLIIGSR